MIIKKTYGPILIPIFLLAFNEISFFWPRLFFLAVALGVLLISLYFYDWKTSDLGRLGRALPLVLFFVGFSFYASVIASAWLVQLLFAGNLIASFSYLSAANDRRADERVNKILMSWGWLVFFLFASALYALELLLSWSPLSLLFIYPLASLAFFVQFWPFNRLHARENYIALVLLALSLTQLAWFISFLPFNYNALGLLLASSYFLFLNIWRLRWTPGDLNRRAIKNQFFLSVVIWALVFLTSNWL